MKTRKIISITMLLLGISLAACQPVNLTAIYDPVRENLGEFFELLGLMTASNQETGKGGEILIATPEIVAEDTALEAADADDVMLEKDSAMDAENALAEPDGRIIYTCQVSNVPGQDQICMVNADGSGFTQLTNDTARQHLYPSWAPDGESFVFSGSSDDGFKIFEMDMDGNSHIVGDIEGELYAPMISPDGARIVFVRHISEIDHYISVMDRDGSNLLDLTDYYDAQDPVWSPEGSLILFSSLQEASEQLYYMNADGTDIRKVAELNGMRGRSDWALDLAIATYSGEKEAHDREIVLLELGSEALTFTDGGDNLSPSFSPDGQWIAFMAYRDHFWESDGCEIYIMRRDGSDIRRLTNNAYCDYQPRWSR